MTGLADLDGVDMSSQRDTDPGKDLIAIDGTATLDAKSVYDVAGVTSEPDKYRSGLDEAYSKLFDAFIQDRNGRTAPPAKKLKIANKYVPQLLKGFAATQQTMRAAVMTNDRMASQIEGASQERSRKRWSKDEDEFLIDAIAGGQTALYVSSVLGRTAEAIKTRVSYLVGISKIESDVAGTFIGTLNGVEVSGNLEGKLKKKPKPSKK